MLDDYVVPLIRDSKNTSHRQLRVLKVAGEAESRLEAKIQPIYAEYPEVETTILSSFGIITIYLRWVGDATASIADSQLNQLVETLRERLGEAVFADQDLSLAEVVGSVLRSNSLFLATAESCTGGLVGKLMTDVPGSSDYYLGGIVCYSNSLKTSLLDVSGRMLKKSGAVSKPVARRMAEGVREKLGSDLGLSITGIAGPGGGSEDKPVGTVFLGMASAEGCKVRRLKLPGDRDMVRLRTAWLALDWLRRYLT
jgi:nicotinamide-nucleotide amidase